MELDKFYLGNDGDNICIEPTYNLDESDIMREAVFADEAPIEPLMDVLGFWAAIDEGYVGDGIGQGYLVIDGKLVQNSDTYCDAETVQVGHYLIPLEEIEGIFGHRAQIDWRSEY